MSEAKLVKCGDTEDCKTCSHHVNDENRAEEQVACHTLNALGHCDLYYPVNKVPKKGY